jgi:cytidyltransferase-like protein
MPKQKVFVSGCFDMLHSGHIRFLEKAAKHGDMCLLLVTKTEMPGSIKL